MENILDSHLQAYAGDHIYQFDNLLVVNWYPKRILMHTKGTKSLLELGLGHGVTADLFSQHFERHVVLDGSPAVIGNFKKNYPCCKSEVIETYFENFKSEEKFDVIVMGFVLEHVDDPVEILRYYKSFLKPDGRLFVAVPNAEVLNRRLGFLAGLLPNMQKLSKHDHLLGHKRYYTVQTIKENMQGQGYVIERIEGIYLKPFTTKQILSLKFDDKIIDALCQIGIDYPELSCSILIEARIS